MADYTDVRPLNDLGIHSYLGCQGGLYPSGTNQVPQDHYSSGIALANTIIPMNANGRFNRASGIIGFAAIGFSITHLIFDEFLKLPRTNINGRIRFCDASESRHQLPDLADINNDYWTTWVPQALSSAGMTFKEIEVVWCLEGTNKTGSEPFPDHALTEKDYWTSVVQNIKTTFPNCKICYLSTLNYFGYLAPSGTGMIPEPYDFEQGFGVKWLIEDQINGSGTLNYDPAIGPVVAPWLSWGGYCWTDGILHRSDGFNFTTDDVLSDGYHPSTSGADKIANSLMHFLLTDPTATPWFRSTQLIAGVPASVELLGDALSGIAGTPLISVNKLPTIGTNGFSIRLEHGFPNSDCYLILGNSLSPIQFSGGTIYPAVNNVLPAQLDSDGTVLFNLGNIPNASGLYGLNQYAQVAINTSGLFTLSECLHFIVGD